jgi:hypothetical protein
MENSVGVSHDGPLFSSNLRYRAHDRPILPCDKILKKQLTQTDEV